MTNQVIHELTGRCACGATTFAARAQKTYGACHCAMCRRWTGGMWMGVLTEELIELSGPVERWQSSRIGARGFCRTCGSCIYHEPRHTGAKTLGQGLFDDQDGWTLTREIFADERPAHYALAEREQKAFTAWGTLVAVLTGRLPR